MELNLHHTAATSKDEGCLREGKVQVNDRFCSFNSKYAPKFYSSALIFLFISKIYSPLFYKNKFKK